MDNLEMAFVLLRKEADERMLNTNNDPVAMLHTCLLEVGILVEKEINRIREEERRRKREAIQEKELGKSEGGSSRESLN